jgi:hypothetical protein
MRGGRGRPIASAIKPCRPDSSVPSAVAMRVSELRRLPTTGIALPRTAAKRSGLPSLSARQAVIS